MKSGMRNRFPLHVTKWIDLDQSPKPLQNSKAANGMERGQNHKKETPTEIGASRYCWQLALNTDPPVTKRCEEWSGQQQRLMTYGEAEILARSIIKMGRSSPPSRAIRPDRQRLFASGALRQADRLSVVGLIRRSHVLVDDGSAQRFGIGRTDPCHKNRSRPSLEGCAQSVKTV